MFGLFKRKKPAAESSQTPPPPRNGGSEGNGGGENENPEKFDYSPESLRVIDEVITKHWPEPPVFLDQVVMTFGSYIGETIRRVQGGRWEFDAERGYTLSDFGGTDTRIYSFAKVHRRFTNGDEDSIAYYYQAVAKIVADKKLGTEPLSP